MSDWSWPETITGPYVPELLPETRLVYVALWACWQRSPRDPERLVSEDLLRELTGLSRRRLIDQLGELYGMQLVQPVMTFDRVWTYEPGPRHVALMLKCED